MIEFEKKKKKSEHLESALWHISLLMAYNEKKSIRISHTCQLHQTFFFVLRVFFMIAIRRWSVQIMQWIGINEHAFMMMQMHQIRKTATHSNEWLHCRSNRIEWSGLSTANYNIDKNTRCMKYLWGPARVNMSKSIYEMFFSILLNRMQCIWKKKKIGEKNSLSCPGNFFNNA